MFDKKLPIIPLKGREKLVLLELLTHVYKESSIVPVACQLEKSNKRDFLTQKYIDQVEPLMLEVKGEVVLPTIPLFDCGMFALNYRKFYS